MKYIYQTKNTCSKQIRFDINDNVITNNVEDAIYLDFRDILDLCRIRVNDISRGSDYGD